MLRRLSRIFRRNRINKSAFGISSGDGDGGPFTNKLWDDSSVWDDSSTFTD